HLRILVLGNQGIEPTVVHVRDTLLLPPDRPAHEIARHAYVLEAQVPVYEALARMRKESVQLAVVMKGGRMKGIVTLADILKCVLPRAEAP
ncbi:MAG: CBS domain-containing protein, partial [Ectothiorhodospira sp.]